MAEPSRHWDRAGLEHKIRSAGRPWTVGDVALIVDGQWAVRTKADGDVERDVKAVVERRALDARRLEMTVEELARAVGSRFGDAHRGEDAD